MSLLSYFGTDDGSLPEILVAFANPIQVSKALESLFSCGARDVSVGGAKLWPSTFQSEQSISGVGHASFDTSGSAGSYHVVLANVACAGRPIPDLGVFVGLDRLTIDYRMGSAWGELEIQSLLELLRQLRTLGGVISVPWWGVDGEQAFMAALGGA